MNCGTTNLGTSCLNDYSSQKKRRPHFMPAQEEHGPADDSRAEKSEEKDAALKFPVAHEGQEKLLALAARFRVAVCGRRFGKTVAAAIHAIAECEKWEGHRVWWISPIQEQSDRVEREMAAWVA